MAKGREQQLADAVKEGTENLLKAISEARIAGLTCEIRLYGKFVDDQTIDVFVSRPL